MKQSKKYVLAALMASIFTIPAWSVAGSGHGDGTYIAIYDTDGDGVVTSDEIIAVRTEDFDSYDANSDGYLSLTEYQNLENAVQTRRLEAAFTAKDADSSSTLTLAEFTGSSTVTTASYWGNVFTLADADGDGSLTQTEFSDLYDHSDHSGIRGFARFDTDYDQAVSLAEYTTVSSRSGGHSGSGGRGGRGRH